MAKSVVIIILVSLVWSVSVGGIGPLLPAAARADQHLKIVLVPEQNIYEQRQRYGLIASYLAKELAMDVRIAIMPSYGKICDAFLDGEADAGFFGSFSYVLTRAKVGIEPVARPVWIDGSSTYSGYIFVRKDSGIVSVADMRDRRLALVDRATTAGYIFQRFYLLKHGVEDMDAYFHQVLFAGGHDASAWAVYTGEADVGGAKNHIYHALEREYADFGDKMRVLARSPDVPSNGLAVRADLDPLLKNRLKEVLLGLEDSPEGRRVLKEFGARRFIANSDDDYGALTKMVGELGLDLETYCYE